MKKILNYAISGTAVTAFLSVACIAGYGGSALSRGVRFQEPPSHKGPEPVDLRFAGSFAILSETGITTTGTTEIIGNLGASPIASTAVTGFGLIMSRNRQFSSSSLVYGDVYAANYAIPTPAYLTLAVASMREAYTDAAGRTSPAPIGLPTELGGLTLAPGLYKTATAVGISKNVTLNGGPHDVWIFQISKGLTQASGTKVKLTGGATASNVFWQVAGVVAIGTTAHMEGEVLGAKGITLNTGATEYGRLLSQTNVTLIANDVTRR